MRGASLRSRPPRRTSQARRPGPDAYRRLAEVYDTVYAWKDYASESRRILALARRYGRPTAHRLLDVGCGTGSHLRHLAAGFEATGIDSSGPMLEVARSRLPHVRFVRGRMESFRLRREFDVITCLFSAIGYVGSTAALRRTVANFARHLAPGGVVIVEPWLSSGRYRVGTLHLETFGTKERPIVRMNLSERRGNRSILDMHYLVGSRAGVRHWVEHHDLGLFEANEYRAAFERAGLGFIALRAGFTGERGLLVGVKPPAVASHRAMSGARSRRPRP